MNDSVVIDARDRHRCARRDNRAVPVVMTLDGITFDLR
jgi:hypothetical protein